MTAAISMMRSTKDQVIPDATLSRRFNARYSIGTPVDQATKIYSLLGRDSVFNELEIEYFFDDKGGKPRLALSAPIWTENMDGGSFPGKGGMQRVSIFSATSKMSAPSFSLPAGPPREGGTCIAAGKGASSLVRPGRGSSPGGARRDAQGKPFICDLCYSTAGNYFYPNVGTAQATRLVWCQRLLAADPSGTLLGQALALALDDIGRRSHYRNLSERLGHEIGVWHRGQIVVPGLVRGRKGLRSIPLEPTELPSSTGYRSTQEFILAHGVEEGAVAGFFRIHDSGDLNIGKLEMWKSYLAAWEYVAKAFPSVWFWMPVRTWTIKEMIPEIQRVSQLPNMVIRASALFVDQKPPVIPGIPSSGVHTGTVTEGHYACPVTPNDKSSCAEEGCRVCWLAPTMTPSYSEH